MALGTLTSIGLGSTLDLQNILDQLKEVEQAPIDLKKSQKTDLENELSAYNSLNAKLLSMKSSALDLSLESEFLNNKVSVDDEEILSASANDGISQTSATINVIKKAEYSSWESAGVESESTVLYSAPESGITDADTTSATSTAETMTIKYGAAESQVDIQIDLTSGMTLNEIAEAINTSDNNKGEDGNQMVSATVAVASILNGDDEYEDQYYIRISDTSGGDSVDSQISVSGYDYVKSDTTISIGLSDDSDPAYMSFAPGTTYAQAVDIINNASDNPGVTAAIIDDGSSENPYKLTLTSKSSGEDNRIQIQNLTLTEVTGADGESLNAEFEINGITYQRQKNDGLTDVISGVTLSLKKVGETSFSVQQDTDPIKENITALIDIYNEVLTDINGSGADDTDDDADDTENPLVDSYSVSNLLNQLKSFFGTTTSAKGEYTSLYDLGMSINEDGTLSLDESALDQALAANADDVKSLFLGDGENGIEGLGDIINSGITTMVGYQGLLPTEIDAAQTKMDQLTLEIEDATERLDKEYDVMAQQFIQLDSYINSLNNEQAALTAMIDSFNSANSD